MVRAYFHCPKSNQKNFSETHMLLLRNIMQKLESVICRSEVCVQRWIFTKLFLSRKKKTVFLYKRWIMLQCVRYLDNFRQLGYYSNKMMNVPPVSSACSTDLFLHAMSAYISIRVWYCIGRYLSVTPVCRFQKQMSVRLYSNWYIYSVKSKCVI